MPKDTTHHRLDSPRKNRFIGAIQVHGNISRACRDHGIASSTGHDLWKKFQETGSTTNLPGAGRHPTFSKPEKACIVQIAVESRRKPFRDIGNEITPSVSGETVRRIVAEEGYHRRVAKKVPYRSELTKEKRRAWALARDKKSLPPREWGNIGWSDEAYICLDDKKGRVWVTRRPGEELLDECCVPVVPQNPIRAMVWGIIAKGFKGPLVVLQYPGGKGGGMTAQRYIQQVLDGPFLHFYQEMKKRRPNFKFQQDGAASHRAKTTQKWLKEHNVIIFPHPPTSPDLSPIEPVWHILKKHIREFRPQPSSYEQLCYAIREAWDQITVDEIDQFVDRMPEVVDAVIKSNGGHTRY
jgi:hypothetical protein